MKRENKEVEKVDKSKRDFFKTTLSLSAMAVLMDVLSPFIPVTKDELQAGPCCYSNCHGARGRR